MKNIRRACLLFALSTISNLSLAGVISYADYYHDDGTDIVIGGGLEWLQWDVAIGQSIDQALSGIANVYGGGGWRLASNIEMSNLLNSFDFGMTFTPAESITQQHILPFDASSELGPHSIFIEMFGNTFAAGGYSIDTDDPYKDSRAFYGSDYDDDNHFNLANIHDDYIGLDATRYGAKAELGFDDWFPSDRVYLRAGVALVRSVPEPPTAILLLAALVMLAKTKRRAFA